MTSKEILSRLLKLLRKSGIEFIENSSLFPLGGALSPSFYFQFKLSIHNSFCLSVYLSVCPRLSFWIVCLFVCLSVGLCVFLTICLSIGLIFSLPVCLSDCLNFQVCFPSLSVFLSNVQLISVIGVSIYVLYLCQSVCLPVFFLSFKLSAQLDFVCQFVYLTVSVRFWQSWAIKMFATTRQRIEAYVTR